MNASGIRQRLPPPDGTGVRDYIHVVDLARGHVKALDFMGGKVGTGKAIGLGSIEESKHRRRHPTGVAIFQPGAQARFLPFLTLSTPSKKACGKLP